MPSSTTRATSTRRRSPAGPDNVDHAYDHCLAVLGELTAAGAAAGRALAAGRRSRPSILAHARHQALAASATPPSYEAAAADGDTVQLGTATDLVGLARALAATRPPTERVVMDLDSRHDLDRAGLGRALGLTPSAAAALAADVADRWDRELGPALLAALGPGPCDGLAVVLAQSALGWRRPDGDAAAGDDAADDEAGDDAGADAPRASIDELLAASPVVAAHLESCDGCQDRVRAMVGVRAVLGQVPLSAAPAAVRRSARMTIARRPAALPPPIDAGGDGDGPAARRTGRGIRWVPLGLAGVAFAIAAVALALLLTHHSGTDKVAALTKVAPRTSLVVSQSEVRPDGTFELRNTSDRTVVWQAHGTERWLASDPASGRLGPGATAVVTVIVAADAPGGAVNGALQLTGDDGSATAIPVNGQVEHPPTLAAQLDGCTVRARAEDEDGVASVTVHWADPAERSSPMAADAGPGARAGGYVAVLPNAPRPLRWSVSATDGRGNVTRTADREIPSGTC
ncbi:MAG: hypothetical protein JWO37_2344 [Acidimicrobiales bacterium]|nr:hypothetical protein [Acidimicrobiales bacterium]